ncbi:lactate utilization protein [Chloroflexota bacterium]
MLVYDAWPDIEATIESLNKNNFDVRFVSTGAEARKMMLKMIPPTARIGVGDSATLRQIGILEELNRRGNKVINPFARELTERMRENPAILKLFVETQRLTLGTDVFLTSTNAVTKDGKIVSMDRAGNRVAGTIFGAKKVILSVGKNKIVKDVNDALHYIKNVIAPAHCKRNNRKTPCAVTGVCADCDSSDRLCNVTIILEKKPVHTDLSIILVNDDLGLGWDPSWAEKRISKIRSNYIQHTEPHFVLKSH